MEEKRAAAGGIVFHGPAAIPAQTNGGSPSDDPREILGKLKKLMESGLIEASEYEAKKAEILGRM